MRDLLILLRDLLILLRDLLILLFDHFIATHDGCIAIFYCLEILVFNIHILTKLCITGGHDEPMEDILHISVVLILCIVYLHDLSVVFLLEGLVKYTENFFQSVVDLSMQERYLHDDTFMDEAVDKRVGKSLCHFMPLIVVGLVVDIEYRNIDFPYSMPKDIHSYHRYSVGRPHLFMYHILRVSILCTEILSEAQRLGLQPCLLQFDENQAQRSVVLADTCSEVDTKHGDVVTKAICVLVAAYLHLHHFFLEQRGKNGTCDALVLHQIFEDGVIDGICYTNDHNMAQF